MPCKILNFTILALEITVFCHQMSAISYFVCSILCTFVHKNYIKLVQKSLRIYFVLSVLIMNNPHQHCNLPVSQVVGAMTEEGVTVGVQLCNRGHQCQKPNMKVYTRAGTAPLRVPLACTNILLIAKYYKKDYPTYSQVFPISKNNSDIYHILIRLYTGNTYQ